MLPLDGGSNTILPHDRELRIISLLMGEFKLSPSPEEIKRGVSKTFFSSAIQKTWSYFMEKGQKAGIFWDGEKVKDKAKV
jgi:hypothetical protein